MLDLAAIQQSLRDFHLDGWLLYDFRGSNSLARRVLDLESKPAGTRRYLYMIQATGEPRKLVHRIESGVLDHLPGEKHVYLTWQELEGGIGGLLSGANRVAMEYAPRVSNPYVAKVDAGVLEVVRGYHAEIISSGDLVQQFEATWDDAQWRMHRAAEKHTTEAFNLAWKLIGERVKAGKGIRETEVQAAIMDYFTKNNLVTYSPPIVAVNSRSGDPHYTPEVGNDGVIGTGDFVLIDLWAKVNQPRSVYSDLTRVGFTWKTIPDKHEEIFTIVAEARDAAIDCVRDAQIHGRPLQGWEVDDAARKVIERAGYGKYFIHRTGHNIGQEVHGNGANMDNLETHEERRVLPRTCFSIEPGIYLPEFGIRSEVNVFVDAEGKVHVTGGPQEKVVPILALT